MNKLLIALMTVIMLFAVGCASSGGSSAVGTGTPIDLGDSSPLPEIEATDDEAVADLPDMVAAEY
jgi:hypothetical protein